MANQRTTAVESPAGKQSWLRCPFAFASNCCAVSSTVAVLTWIAFVGWMTNCQPPSIDVPIFLAASAGTGIFLGVSTGCGLLLATVAAALSESGELIQRGLLIHLCVGVTTPLVGFSLPFLFALTV